MWDKSKKVPGSLPSLGEKKMFLNAVKMHNQMSFYAKIKLLKIYLLNANGQ